MFEMTDLDDTALDTLIVPAVQYALPAHTYIVGTISDFVIRHVGDISTKKLSVIQRDIRRRLSEDWGAMDAIDAPRWAEAAAAVEGEMALRGYSYSPTTGAFEEEAFS